MSREAERGWKLVPVEPTQDMLDVVTSAEGIEPFTDSVMAGVWREMVAAAPPPPASEAGDAGSAIVERLRHLVSLNEPRNGGPYAGHAATACVEAMDEAADLILALQAEVTKLRDEIDSFWPNSHVSAVWKIVRDLGDFSAAEVVSQAGLARKATYNALTYLAKQGKIVRRGYGRYALLNPQEGSTK